MQEYKVAIYVYTTYKLTLSMFTDGVELFNRVSCVAYCKS